MRIYILHIPSMYAYDTHCTFYQDLQASTVISNNSTC